MASRQHSPIISYIPSGHLLLEKENLKDNEVFASFRKTGIQQETMMRFRIKKKG